MPLLGPPSCMDMHSRLQRGAGHHEPAHLRRATPRMWTSLDEDLHDEMSRNRTESDQKTAGTCLLAFTILLALLSCLNTHFLYILGTFLCTSSERLGGSLPSQPYPLSSSISSSPTTLLPRPSPLSLTSLSRCGKINQGLVSGTFLIQQLGIESFQNFSTATWVVASCFTSLSSRKAVHSLSLLAHLFFPPIN